MRRILRLNDEDIRGLIMEHYDRKPSEVVSVYTEEVTEDGDTITPVYYVEVDITND